MIYYWDFFFVFPSVEKHSVLASPAPQGVIDSLTPRATYALALGSEWKTE